jgi:hypothetical protein
MADYGVGHLQKCTRSLAGCDHPIHLAQQPFRVAAVVALGSRCEKKLQRHPEDNFQNETDQHLIVAARMPNARARALGTLPELRQIAPAHLWQTFRQAWSKRDDATSMTHLFWNKLHNR